MGGSVSCPAPLSERLMAVLKDKYENYKGRGCADDEIQGILDEKLPSMVCFDQVDSDHSGTVSVAELKAFLQTLPRKKPVAAPGAAPAKFVPFEKLVETLDGDGDGSISLKEWLENLERLPGLKMALERAMDPVTHRMPAVQSLEAQVAALEERRAAGAERPGDADELDRLRGVVGTVGLTVFRQIDADGSGKIDRQELLAALKHLNRYSTPDRKLDAGAAIAALDVDGDALIDEYEWVAQLYVAPGLKATIEATVDPETGRIKGYLEEEDKARVAKARGEWAKSAHDLLAAVEAAPAPPPAEAKA